MCAIPPIPSPLWQRPAHDRARGGCALDFNAPSSQNYNNSAKTAQRRSGLHPTSHSFAPRSGLYGAGPCLCRRQGPADGWHHAKFPFSTAMDAVESQTIKTLTRGSQTWSRNTLFSHRSLRSRSRAASKAAVTAILRLPTARWSALSAVLLRVRSLLTQPAAPKPKARLSALSQAACPAASLACQPATDLVAADLRRTLITDHSKAGSFSLIGWKALFHCRTGFGPTLPEGRESLCSRKF